MGEMSSWSGNNPPLLPARRDRSAAPRHAAISRLLLVEELFEHRLQLRLRPPPALGVVTDQCVAGMLG